MADDKKQQIVPTCSNVDLFGHKVEFLPPCPFPFLPPYLPPSTIFTIHCLELDNIVRRGRYKERQMRASESSYICLCPANCLLLRRFLTNIQAANSFEMVLILDKKRANMFIVLGIRKFINSKVGFDSQMIKCLWRAT